MQGPKGDKGDAGPQGPKDDKGDTGSRVIRDLRETPAHKHRKGQREILEVADCLAPVSRCKEPST